MRQQLRECDVAFTSLLEFRPELRDSPRQLDALFLQNMQQTCAPETFSRRPEEHARISCPWNLAARIAKSAVQIEDRVAVLPDGDSGAKFTALAEVFLEQRRQPVSQFVGAQFHRTSPLAAGGLPAIAKRSSRPEPRRFSDQLVQRLQI